MILLNSRWGSDLSDKKLFKTRRRIQRFILLNSMTEPLKIVNKQYGKKNLKEDIKTKDSMFPMLSFTFMLSFFCMH